MSEEPNVLPDKPEDPQSPESQPEQAPSQPAPANSEQYPPLPSFYASADAPDPYGAPVTNYGAGQPVYGTPPPAYGAPPVGYGMPPLMPPPGYGMPPFAERPAYDFGPPVQPLPLGQAIRELPGQYLKILKKPSARSFAEEQGKADWDIIWMQLLFVAVLGIISFISVFQMEIHIFSLLSSTTSNLPNTAGNPGVSPTFPTFPTFPASVITIGVLFVAIFTPLVVLGWMGLQYLVAKAFRGTGKYKQQVYTYLLFYVPIQVIVAVLYLIILPLISLSSNPLLLLVAFIPTLVASGLGIYSIILNVFSVMGVHRLSGGKGTGVVLIPYGVIFVLYFVGIIAFVFIALSTSHP